MIIIQRRSSPLYGAILLWYGSSGSLPTGWDIYAAAQGYYVQGAIDAGDINETATGADTHTHTNSATGADGIHNHTGSANVDSSGSSVSFQAAGSNISSPHNHTGSVTVSNNASTHTHTVSNSGSGSTRPKTAIYYWIKWGTASTVPIGAIVMWFGTSATIPSGWLICDGTNGTRDLVSYFVEGAANDGEVTNTSTGGHVHTNSATDSDGAHTHPASISVSGDASRGNGVPAGTVTSAPASHSGSHGASGNTASNGAHTHTIANATTATVVPPAYYLYYIQKVV